jgi:hypothetical protein
VASGTDQVQGVIADHARDLCSVAPFTRRRFEPARQRRPIQRDTTFTFAALDRQFETLHGARENERLLHVGGDAQIIFLSQVSHLRMIFTLGSF